jgi:hypothetical protein
MKSIIVLIGWLFIFNLTITAQEVSGKSYRSI